MLGADRGIPGGEWKLTLEYVLAELVSDGFIEESQARELGIGRPVDSGEHPLVRIAAQEWQSAKPPRTPSTRRRPRAAAACGGERPGGAGRRRARSVQKIVYDGLRC